MEAMVWIVKKGISCLLILLGVTFVTFSLMQLAGGDAISYFYENQGTAVSPEIMDAMRKKYGLDQPFLLQYGQWLLHAIMGDMGESYVSGRAVLPLLASKIPHTLYLAVVSVALTLMVSVPLGVLSAVRKGGWCDSLASGLSFLGNAMPNFFVAILLIYLLAVKMKWFPAVSVGRSPSVILPAVTLAIAMSAKYTRQIRGVVLAELRKGYVMGARARGVSEGTILWKSVIPMASPAIVTLLAISIGSLLSGTAVVETIFLWDGVGKLAVDAIMQRDYPIIQAYVVWMAGIYILVNGAGDVVSRLLGKR